MTLIINLREPKAGKVCPPTTDDYELIAALLGELIAISQTDVALCEVLSDWLNGPEFFESLYGLQYRGYEIDDLPKVLAKEAIVELNLRAPKGLEFRYDMIESYWGWFPCVD